MHYSLNLIVKLKKTFRHTFNTLPELVFSPGRINLIGEHTDYNDGFVMPAAIDKGIYIAFSKNDLSVIRLLSMDFDQYLEIPLDTDQPVSKSWANYILGVVSEIRKLSKVISGFDMVFSGNLPIGAGLSSSAALECGVGIALNHLFQLKLEKIEIIKAGQQAEHNYVGVRCGIMDQFASTMGKENHSIQLDCRSLEYKYFSCDFKEYQLLLCNSKVKHSLAESEYNKRREECETGVLILKSNYPKIENLRDVSLEMLTHIIGNLSHKIYNRCSYVIEENQRVLAASQFLKNDNLIDFGKLLFGSHEGLSEKYEVSCKELDFLVTIARENPCVLGARMMGGGFGGCTLNLVKRSEKQKLINVFQKKYTEKYGIDPEFYEVELKNGTHLIKSEIYESV